MEKPIISFKDFSFQYVSQAEPTLKNINLEIYPGQKVLIAGPSGSGKSTLAKCLNGLIPNEDHGEIHGSCTINGRAITETSLFDLSFTTSTILQDSDSQFIGLTVAEDIAFALENDAVSRAEMQQIVDKWATELNLHDLLNHSPQELSGGQKQRVALAGVLVDGSPILLFDEPLANLDPVSGHKTMQLIEQIQAKTNATVIIIEHRLEEALTCPLDRVLVMSDGQIIADQTPNELLRTDILPNAGIRPPLYVEALKAANVDLTKIPDLASVQKLPVLPEITQALATLKGSTTLSNNETPVPQLSLENVSFSYSAEQKYPLSNISFTVNAGDFISIAGQNGAGKTTLVKLICGFLQGSGKITWENQDLAQTSIKERAEKIGYVMQDPNQMISQKMIFDEVALGLRLHGITDENEIKQKVAHVLKICGLYPFRNWPISALSYGQKKRVTIASILVLEPKLIILDEPTAGQDQQTYTEIMQFLQELNEQHGCTIIIITHDMHLMLEYTKRALVFSQGQLLADLTPVQLLSQTELLKQADLRQTSLYHLAQKYQLADTDSFIAGFDQLVHQKGEHHE
ncbi:ABC transporter ATP-binding protein [Ligilactobacillus apodemi]|uniref:ABC superfamily ATP binding cassette transporter n=1 Tax=Ligilactobacillus apodemi DSM 16634 = JCM 16172 TaxID=1423724 RepID=A0A0R1U1Y7_9LACO|nr:ABC transporter ATP-binding protein [Ligilactobacillus apodemi]KRL87366.1 ABC superfamily ATP binding cassette transporter [Ligilactobacillus apodemi DSM 16634 = JCM 16172]MCR1901702.1 ABC transporter ATP-binding protein [Ligilactobacillus apodemi]